MFDHSKTILHHNHGINSDYLSCLLIYGLVLIELSTLVLYIIILYETNLPYLTWIWESTKLGISGNFGNSHDRPLPQNWEFPIFSRPIFFCKIVTFLEVKRELYLKKFWRIFLGYIEILDNWGFKLVLWVQNQQKLPFEYWDGSVDFDLAHATWTSVKSEFCVLLRNKNMKSILFLKI